MIYICVIRWGVVGVCNVCSGVVYPHFLGYIWLVLVLKMLGGGVVCFLR